MRACKSVEEQSTNPMLVGGLADRTRPQETSRPGLRALTSSYPPDNRDKTGTRFKSRCKNNV